MRPKVRPNMPGIIVRIRIDGEQIGVFPFPMLIDVTIEGGKTHNPANIVTGLDAGIEANVIAQALVLFQKVGLAWKRSVHGGQSGADTEDVNIPIFVPSMRSEIGSDVPGAIVRIEVSLNDISSAFFIDIGIIRFEPHDTTSVLADLETRILD